MLRCVMSAFGTKRTSRHAEPMSAFEGKADIESPPKFFQGPEDGWVPTFAKLRPNALPRGLARGPLKVSLRAKSGPVWRVVGRGVVGIFVGIFYVRVRN